MYKRQEVDSSLYYFNKLKPEFSTDTTRKIEILARINLADAYIEKTLFETGDSILKATIPIAESKNNTYLLTKLYFDLAECNRLNFKNEVAIRYQKIALKYAKKCNEAYFVSVGYINISEVLLVEANYNNCLLYTSRCV